MLDNFIQKHLLPERFAQTANNFYIPLANTLAHKAKQQFEYQAYSTYFVGINGCQGSGKSTLVEFLANFLTEQFDLSVVVLSLDDFYFSKAKRQQLAQQQHPLFETRGVPGTHDVNLLKSILVQLKDSKQSVSPISLPQFDKAQDNVLPMKTIPSDIKAVDIVLFEGWCWGVPAQTTDALCDPINSLETEHDPQGIWRKQINRTLQQDYQPLYDYMNTWLMLKAPSFDIVFQWRLEQEQKLAKLNLNNPVANSVMNSAEVSDFIHFFQRLTMHGLNVLPKKVDILFELNNSREVIASRGLDNS